VALRFDEKALFGIPKINVTSSGPRKNINVMKRVQKVTASSAGQKLRKTERVGRSMTTERTVLRPTLPRTPRYVTDVRVM
jgi:hypothetical protein